MDFKNWISEFGGKQGDFFKRNYYVLRNENYESHKNNFIKKCNNIDVYECAYHYENEDIDNCNIIGNPYLDFDIDEFTEENWNKLVKEVKYVINYIELSMKIPPEELSLYFSGSKGFHLIIPCKSIGIEPSKTLNNDFKLFAEGLAYISHGKNKTAAKQSTLDLKIYDKKRLFRLPGSINSKSGLFKVSVSIEQLYKYNLKLMLRWASERRKQTVFVEPKFRAISKEGYNNILLAGKEYEDRPERKSRKEAYKPELKQGERLELLPCSKQLLEAGAMKGTRNQSCFALSNSLFQCGYKINEVQEMLFSWNERCEEPLGQEEVLTTIQSAKKDYDNEIYVGCGRYRDLDMCSLHECPLLKN